MTEVGSIVIGYGLDEEGELITSVSVEGDLPVVVSLGLLELAKDTILATANDEETE